MKQAFGKADDILASAAKGIAEIITVESDLVNVDFADVSKVMRDSGRAHMTRSDGRRRQPGRGGGRSVAAIRRCWITT